MLLPKFIELMADSKGKMNKVALGIDLRGREFFRTFMGEHLMIYQNVHGLFLIFYFLDAKDSTLVTRYKETRRSHPLAPTGLPLKGIEAERNLLTDMKARANIVLDTSDLKTERIT